MAEIAIYDAMRTLRAVRRLRPDPIADDVLRRVLEAATWAPTGGNRQPWRVIVVKERAIKERLGALYAEQYTKFIARYRANLASGEPAARERTERMLRASDYLSEHFAQSPVIAVFLLQSDRVGHHGFQPVAYFRSRRRIDLPRRREPVARLPGRRAWMRAHNSIVRLRARS